MDDINIFLSTLSTETCKCTLRIYILDQLQLVPNSTMTLADSLAIVHFKSPSPKLAAKCFLFSSTRALPLIQVAGLGS
jgi:hypothetical protein